MASIGAHLSLAGYMLVALVAGLLPRVEDPWPESIGLGFPFSSAGAFGVLAGVVFFRDPPARRDRAIAIGALLGFCSGAVLYIASLITQLCSNV